MNINCLECCKYEVDGKCSLSQVSSFSDLNTSSHGCAYFIPKPFVKKTSTVK